MRIIGGRYKGKPIHPPKGLLLRPTTDFAKEALFNILNNRIDLEGAEVLDLFCGTGNISFEFGSRGSRVTSVDANFRCCAFIRDTAATLSLSISTVKTDVFSFLKSSHSQFDLIFADPPYDLETIPSIHGLVLAGNLLKPGGLLIIEHGAKTKLEGLDGYSETRKYGNVNFSFFELSS